MAFIRCRIYKTKDHDRRKSYQLVETFRENGKVKQRVVANLAHCATVEEAIPVCERYVESLQKRLDTWQADLANAEASERDRTSNKGEDELYRVTLGSGAQPSRTMRNIRKQVVHWQQRVACEETNLKALKNAALELAG